MSRTGRRSPARAVQSLRLRGRDLGDRLAGRGDPLVPPRRMWFVGDGDFRATADAYLAAMREQAGLRPGERVLDIGCGIGRMARPLAGFLGAEASYEGFDPSATGIEWCRRAYSDRHPSFQFVHVDAYNAQYNPGGSEPAGSLRFPYPDADFDFAFATSVFTHLVPAETEHYFDELARVLRRGGRALLTFFLLDSESRSAQMGEGSAFCFTEPQGPAAHLAGERPERAIAYDEAWVIDGLAARGLPVRMPVAPGHWSGRANGGPLFQDSLVCDRE